MHACMAPHTQVTVDSEGQSKLKELDNIYIDTAAYVPRQP